MFPSNNACLDQYSTHIVHFLFYILTRTMLTNQVVYLISLMNPSSCNSFTCLSISSNRSGAIFLRLWHIGFASGLTTNLWQKVWVYAWHICQFPCKYVGIFFEKGGKDFHGFIIQVCSNGHHLFFYLFNLVVLTTPSWFRPRCPCPPFFTSSLQSNSLNITLDCVLASGS